MTLPARHSRGPGVTGSPPLALGTRASTCSELAQRAVWVEGYTSPQSCHPGPPWDGISSDNRVRTNLPQQPLPSACSKWAGGPAPGPLPSALWLCSGRCREHCPRAPVPAPSFLPGAIRHRRALCPSGTLGHTLYRLPCPHTKSLSGQLTLLYIFIEEPTPTLSSFSP